MLTFGASSRDLIVVGGSLSATTRLEAREAIAEGARLTVYQSRYLHDRFFAIDGEWYRLLVAALTH
jgi:hypothetical protein